MTGPMAFGRMCLNRMRVWPAPSALAAVTKSDCFWVMTAPRMTRASCIQPKTDRPRVTVHTVRLVNAWSSTSAPSSSGMPKNTSVIRDRRASAQPPKYPASMPSRPPKTVTAKVTQTPTMIEARAP